jgi:regulator of nucleoside diphosphate kinase
MMERSELFVSARDAEELAAMLAAHRRSNPFEADASDELAERLLEARLVPADKLPDGCVGLRTMVSYEEPSGLNRTVTLVLPQATNAAQGRISVLSPIGLALLGHRRGEVVNAATPNGKALTIRIVDATRADHPIAEAA